MLLWWMGTEHRLENESIVEHGLKKDRSWTTGG